jgi:hypothetical protein
LKRVRFCRERHIGPTGYRARSFYATALGVTLLVDWRCPCPFFSLVLAESSPAIDLAEKLPDSLATLFGPARNLV